MRLELRAPVACSDGPFGELADVVIDPIRRRVTHLVVSPHKAHGGARLVPVELVRSEAFAAIMLGCTTDELRRLPAVEEFAYLRYGDFPLDDPDWQVGIETVLAQPYYEYPGFSAGVVGGLDPHYALVYDRVPKGEVEIRRASAVQSSDRHRLGHVDGFLVDRDGGITHLVLERGHLFGRRDVTVPISDVERVETDAVELRLTKDEVAALPTVPVRRGHAHLADGDGPQQQALGG